MGFLAKLDEATKVVGKKNILLSWGHDDVETYVSAVPLANLLGPEMMVHLR